MEPKSDKGYILRWVVACLIVIAIFHFSWASYLLQNWSNSWEFTMVDILLVIAFIYSAINAIVGADDPNKDYWRYVFVILTIVSSAWAAGWSITLMDTVK